MGKSFDTHAPCGPELVTLDELGDPDDLGLRTWVNDDLRQDSRTSDLIFGLREMIEYLTSAFPLEPGTIIATGTPAGVGAGFDPPRFLRDGDVVRIAIEGLGELRNPVVQGLTPGPVGLRVSVPWSGLWSRRASGTAEWRGARYHIGPERRRTGGAVDQIAGDHGSHAPGRPGRWR